MAWAPDGLSATASRLNVPCASSYSWYLLCSGVVSSKSSHQSHSGCSVCQLLHSPARDPPEELEDELEELLDELEELLEDELLDELEEELDEDDPVVSPLVVINTSLAEATI